MLRFPRPATSLTAAAALVLTAALGAGQPVADATPAPAPAPGRTCGSPAHPARSCGRPPSGSTPAGCTRPGRRPDRPAEHGGVLDGRLHLARTGPRRRTAHPDGRDVEPLAARAPPDRRTGQRRQARLHPALGGPVPGRPGPDESRTPRALDLVLIDPGVLPSDTVATGPAAAQAGPGDGDERATARAAHPQGVGREPELAQREPGLPRQAQADPRPPHRHRERLLAGGRAGHPARHVPLPHQDTRLVRHRLQLPGRPLRTGLGRPLRWRRTGWCGAPTPSASTTPPSASP